MSYDDETRPVKVHKITLIVVDHDQLGADSVRQVLEDARYPNHCIGPIVIDTKTVEVQYNDKHPINNTTKMHAAAKELFDVQTRPVVVTRRSAGWQGIAYVVELQGEAPDGTVYVASYGSVAQESGWDVERKYDAAVAVIHNAIAKHQTGGAV